MCQNNKLEKKILLKPFESNSPNKKPKVRRNPEKVPVTLEVTTLSKTIQKKPTSQRGKSSILIGSSSGVSVSPTRADLNVDPSGENRRTASKGGRDQKS